MNQFLYNNKRSQGQWRLAEQRDITAIVDMAKTLFQIEIEEILRPDPYYYAWNLDKAITDQRYNLSSQFLALAEDTTTGQLLAYTWISRGNRTPYSQDEMAEAKMAHVNLKLSTRDRINLLRDMIDLWERWAVAIGVPVIVSTSIRSEQEAFLHLHSRAGYVIKGSIAWKRLQGEIDD